MSFTYAHSREPYPMLLSTVLEDIDSSVVIQIFDKGGHFITQGYWYSSNILALMERRGMVEYECTNGLDSVRFTLI